MNAEDYLFSIVEGIQEKEAASGYASLDKREKVFFAIWTLEAEVNNGGFDQFYFNSSGDVALEVPGALRAIGANHTAEIVDKANALFGTNGPSPDIDVRQEQLEQLTERDEDTLGQFDDAFYAYEDNLSTRLAAYMQS